MLIQSNLMLIQSNFDADKEQFDVDPEPDPSSLQILQFNEIQMINSLLCCRLNAEVELKNFLVENSRGA